MQQEITDAIEAQMHSLVLEMEWEKGDFMINDNLGLAHYAVPGTQEDPDEVRVRVRVRIRVRVRLKG